MTHLEKTDQDFFELHDLILQEKPIKSDAIVWLQGDQLDRGPKTVALYRDGLGKKVIITGNNVLVGKWPRPGEQNITVREMQAWLEQQGVSRKDIIIDDESMNTKDQAVNVLKLAKVNGMSKLLLVGSSFYQPRTFLTFLKEAKRQGFIGKFINQPAIVEGEMTPAGRNKPAKEIINDEIDKIKKYKNDLEDIKSGTEYLKCPFPRLRVRMKSTPPG